MENTRGAGRGSRRAARSPGRVQPLANPGTEDQADRKAQKCEHICTYDCLNRMVSGSIAKTFTSYTYDTLGNLTLETVKNKSVDYIYNELNQLVRKTTSTNDVYTYSYDGRGNCTGAERGLRPLQRGGGGAKKGADKPPEVRRRARLFLASILRRRDTGTVFLSWTEELSPCPAAKAVLSLAGGPPDRSDEGSD